MFRGPPRFSTAVHPAEIVFRLIRIVVRFTTLEKTERIMEDVNYVETPI